MKPVASGGRRWHGPGRLLLTGALGITLALLPANAAGAAEDFGAGEALFERHCSRCHTRAGEIREDVNIVRTIRDPPFGMPEYEQGVLSEKDIESIAAYVKSQILKRMEKQR